MNTVIYLSKFNNLLPSCLRLCWRSLSCSQRSTSSCVSFNRLLWFTIFTSFLVDVKQTFSNVFKTHHKLGSCRSTPSHVGGFTSKSNKWFTYFCNSMLKCSQRGVSQLTLRISHKSHNPHKEELERAQQGYGCILFVGSFSNIQRGGGGRGGGRKYLYLSQKLAVRN
jgi:hypothetical protein